MMKWLTDEPECRWKDVLGIAACSLLLVGFFLLVRWAIS